MVSIWMPSVMYIMRAGFGDGALTGVEGHFDELHFVAVHLEVDVVGATARHGRRSAGTAPPRPAGSAASVGTAPSGVQFCMPDVNTSVSRRCSPSRIRETMSSSLMGPTLCPPIARNHCCAICCSAEPLPLHSPWRPAPLAPSA